MQYKHINKFINLIKDVEDFDKREIIGCTPEQMLQIQQVHPSRMDLPTAFQEFLIFGGQRIAYWYPASGFYYSYLIEMNSKKNLNNTFFSEKYYKDFVGLDFKSPFPKDAFIFYGNQGYEYQYIRLSEGEDPPVYFFDDDLEKTDFEKTANTFSEWLYRAGEDFINFHDKKIAKREDLRHCINTFKKQLLNTIDGFKNANKKYNLNRLSTIISFYELALNLVYRLYSKDQKSHHRIRLYLDNYKVLKKAALPVREYNLLAVEVDTTMKLFELVPI